MCFKIFSKKKNNDSQDPFSSRYSEPFSTQNLDPFPAKDGTSFSSQSDSSFSNSSFSESPFSSRDEKPYEPKPALSPDSYTFTLTEFGGNIDGGFRETDDPTEADLKNAVDNLALNDGEFFTLIGNESINGYRMLGGMTVYGDTLLTASVHVETGMKHGKHVGKAYDKQVTPEQLLVMLKDFLNCRTPNVKDGTWVFDKDLDYPD